MHQLPHPEDVREIALRTFSELCGRVIGRDAMRETILIRDEHYYGRAYRASGLLATFVAETATLTFHSEAGHLLRSVGLAQTETGEQRQAA